MLDNFWDNSYIALFFVSIATIFVYIWLSHKLSQKWLFKQHTFINKGFVELFIDVRDHTLHTYVTDIFHIEMMLEQQPVSKDYRNKNKRQ